MNFSDIIPFTGYSNLAYSPGSGDLIAIGRGMEVQVLETSSLQVTAQFAFTDTVKDIKWSPDGHFLLISVPKRNLVYVKSIDDQDWNCKIDEGIAGLAYARWVPDSR
jgi:hypothetical protein